MIEPSHVLQALLLVMVANGAPILATWLTPGWWGWPLDGGRRWRDGRPLLGPSKTWRGLFAALLAGSAFAVLMGYPWYVGLSAGAGAMAGDLLSSFLKRRRGTPSSGAAPGLDQMPEALLGALALVPWLPLSALEILLVVVLFFFLEIPLSMLLYRLGVRRRPR